MFRPCIDLHEGRVKQIVGGSLEAAGGEGPRTNFVSALPSSWYARLYRDDELPGGHVVMLGPGNEAAALEALQAYPGGMQVGGGITPANAAGYLSAGASHVIVTSWLFREGRLDRDRLAEIAAVTDSGRLVLDLSCRRRGDEYVVVSEHWQVFTDLVLSEQSLAELSLSCAEFLIHGVDVEGLSTGIDECLVRLLARWSPIPTTYAGGARSLQDLQEVTRISNGRVHLTIGSALDIFGGTGVRYADVVAFNRRLRTEDR
jgi:phosphoribosylformimino-5-aminoimidazole carboxamide ribotide isomerase